MGGNVAVKASCASILLSTLLATVNMSVSLRPMCEVASTFCSMRRGLSPITKSACAMQISLAHKNTGKHTASDQVTEETCNRRVAEMIIELIWILQVEGAFDEDQIVVLRAPSGAEAHILTFGAIIQSLIVPDREGILSDVALGFDSIEPYQVKYLISIDACALLTLIFDLQYLHWIANWGHKCIKCLTLTTAIVWASRQIGPLALFELKIRHTSLHRPRHDASVSEIFKSKGWKGCYSAYAWRLANGDTFQEKLDTMDNVHSMWGHGPASLFMQRVFARTSGRPIWSFVEWIISLLWSYSGKSGKQNCEWNFQAGRKVVSNTTQWWAKWFAWGIHRLEQQTMDSHQLCEHYWRTSSCTRTHKP